MREVDVILERTEEFHGHLDSFLVIGARMGLIGLREPALNYMLQHY